MIPPRRMLRSRYFVRIGYFIRTFLYNALYLRIFVVPGHID